MVAAHRVGWLAPAPLWSSVGPLASDAARGELLRPAILRFAHDAFMEELLAALAYHPERLREWRAVYETWEQPMAAPAAVQKLALPEPVSRLSLRLSREAKRRAALAGPGQVGPALPAAPSQPPSKPLKLYQPVQQRHYLVAASLVCRTPGLPDRRVDAGKQERAAFVLRRIVLPAGATQPATDPAAWDEHAFVESPGGTAWQGVKAGGAADRLLPGEQRLPLFSLGFEEAPGRGRRLFAGSIPVGRREAYVAARTRAAAPGEPGDAAAPGAAADTRLLLLQMRVTAPWSDLVQQALDEMERFDKRPSSFLGESAPGGRDPATVKSAFEQAQTASWYIALDLERFLHDRVTPVWEVLAGTRSRSGIGAAGEALLAWLEGVVLAPSLRAALGSGAKANLLQVLETLARAPSIGERLERVEVPFDRDAPHADWPGLRFPLADIGANGPFPFTVGGTDMRGRVPPRDALLGRLEETLAQLVGRVRDALPAAQGASLPEIPVPADPQVDTRAAWFAIRCVYERPNCGPFDPPAVSEPTQPFEMASFFDPEAPARPVRIALPVDITPAALRRYNKSATLQISDMLCGQLKRIRKMTLGDLVLSVLPWPFHKDLPDPSGAGPCTDGGNPLGMFCSLSIPIVTIVALVLMIIIVSLLDLVFRWLPYLFLCLPIPGFKGKRE